MTQTLGVNTANDLYIGNDGNLVIVTGLTAILQACMHAARAILGEMIYATDQGIPYFQVIWVGTPNIPQFEIALRMAFLNIDGVIEIVSLFTTQTGNILNYSAVILTNAGTGTING